MSARPVGANRILRVEIGGRRYRLLAPRDPEALLDDADVLQRFAEDEHLPYWARLWPAALLLAAEVAAWPPTGAERVLELGCGLGLVGLVAGAVGRPAVLTDCDRMAVSFAQINIRINRLSRAEGLALAYGSTLPDTPFERVLAADVLYERRHLTPVASCIARHLAPAGVGLVCDPDRGTADEFPAAAAEAGLACTVRRVSGHGLGGEAIAGRVFELRHEPFAAAAT
ncbi:MAG: methyltransferase domain-containing protein [Phycisphaerales bacterium]|nr:methyltransferase domain-containing protein [Phycisphaerales bacterium]